MHCIDGPCTSLGNETKRNLDIPISMTLPPITEQRSGIISVNQPKQMAKVWTLLIRLGFESQKKGAIVEREYDCCAVLRAEDT